MTTPMQSGWLPAGTGLDWLDELRGAHERLVAELQAARGGVAAIERRHAQDDDRYAAACRVAAETRQAAPGRSPSESPEFRAAELEVARAAVTPVADRFARFVAGAVEVVFDHLDELWAMTGRDTQHPPAGIARSPEAVSAWREVGRRVAVFVRAAQAPENWEAEVAEARGLKRLPSGPRSVGALVALADQRAESEESPLAAAA